MGILIGVKIIYLLFNGMMIGVSIFTLNFFSPLIYYDPYAVCALYMLQFLAMMLLIYCIWQNIDAVNQL